MNRLNVSIRLFVGALTLVTLGCSNDDLTAPVDPATQTFASSLNVNLSQMTKSSSGLYIRDEVVGTGALATAGSSVLVDYTGSLHTGTQFESSTTLVQNLGGGRVIEGWDEGLVGMRVGGRRLLVIPSGLGYGARRQGPIPPYSTLVFRVTLRTVS